MCDCLLGLTPILSYNKVLFDSFGWEYLSAGLIRVVIIILTYLSPQLMNLLLQYLQTQTPPPAGVPLELLPPRQDVNIGGSIVGAMVIIMVLNVGLGAMFTWLCDVSFFRLEDMYVLTLLVV